MTEILLNTPAPAPNGPPATGTVNGAGAAAPPLAQPTLQTPTTGVAEFEGTSVASATSKVTGTTVIDGDQVVSLDDIVRVVGEFQVVKVGHEIGKDGQVVRVQLLKARADLTLVPWDPADPNDVGIIRARP